MGVCDQALSYALLNLSVWKLELEVSHALVIWSAAVEDALVDVFRFAGGPELAERSDSWERHRSKSLSAILSQRRRT